MSRKKKVLAIIGVGIAGIIGIILLALTLTKPVKDAGDRFLEAVKTKNFVQAYALCSPALQAELKSPEGLQERIGTYGLSTWSFSSRNIENNLGRVSGSGVNTEGKKVSVELVFSKQQGQWIVEGFRFNPLP